MATTTSAPPQSERPVASDTRTFGQCEQRRHFAEISGYREMAERSIHLNEPVRLTL
jgi:hypothetical protein